MSDSVFRTSQPQTPTTEPLSASEDVSQDTVEQSTSAVEAPTDLLATYEETTGKPYTSEYYELGDMWNRETSLKTDLQRIEQHLREKVSRNELNNSVKSASKYLKELEKKADIDPVIDSTNRRIEKLSAYIDFLDVIK